MYREKGRVGDLGVGMIAREIVEQLQLPIPPWVVSEQLLACVGVVAVVVGR